MNAAKVETLPEKFIASRYPAELVDSTSFPLKKLGFKAKERAFDAFDEIGMNPYHYAVLAALAEDSHETQGALADALGYDRGQMVGILDELEEQELILRRRDPTIAGASSSPSPPRAAGRSRAFALSRASSSTSCSPRSPKTSAPGCTSSCSSSAGSTCRPAPARLGKPRPAGSEAQTALGSGTMRMYGFGSSHSPNSSFASSFETEPAMITSSPRCQLTGVETLCFAVSWSESITRSTSSKLRPVVIG